MVVTNGQFAPYAPVGSVLTVIRRFRERGLPDPLTPQELTRLGISEGNTSRTLQALRFLGVLDDEGRRTPLFDRLRRASTSEYEEVFAEIIRAAYQRVFTIVDPATASEIEISDAFRHFTPERQRDRMVTLFVGLCREAGVISGGAPEQPMRRPSIAVIRPATAASRRTVRSSSSASVPLSSEQQQTASAVTVALPDYRVLDALFQQLPQSGRWTKERRDRWLQAVAAGIDLLVDIIPTEEPARLIASPHELPITDATSTEESYRDTNGT